MRNICFILLLLFLILVSLYVRVNEGFEGKELESDSDSDSEIELESETKVNFDYLLLGVGYKTLYKEDSKYQNIEVIQFHENEDGYDKCLLLNDEIQLCNNNEEKSYHELIVHFPSYYLGKVEHVLIIGGGDLMTLREVMKYSTIKKVTMVEIDEQVIEVGRKYFGQNDFSEDDRVELFIEDASIRIKELPKAFYDMVIIDSTEESSNNMPLDKEEFLRQCKRVMKPENSILIKNGHTSKEMPEEYNKSKMIVYDSLKELFSTVRTFKIEISSFSQEYTFLICSNTFDFTESRQNSEILEMQKNLTEYHIKKHSDYLLP